MKNLVFTISIGEHYNKLAKFTHKSIEMYAKKIGADFLNITENNDNFIVQKWQKFQIFNLLNQYNRIIYVDTDLIIREDCPNLFDIVPEDKIGMFNEGKYAQRLRYIQEASEFYDKELLNWNGKFYNSGVMVISRYHKQLFKLPPSTDEIKTDQAYINLMIHVDKYDIFDLDYRFNRMDLLDKYIGISRLDSYIVHYAGAPKNQIFEVLTQDINQWKLDSPKFHYDQNIAIVVSAGMGDQLCSEPVIRYIKNKIYPDSNIKIITHYPRLFEHIDVPIFNYEQWNGSSDSMLLLKTCPDDNESDNNLSHVLFHPTDFASISTIRQVIPNIDKTIKLKVKDDDIREIENIVDISDLKNYILIHPGKWWQSKTFPIEWWQDVIDKLSKKYKVGIIGKRIDDKQGYVNVKCPKNAVDFRDITSLGGLIALISKSKITLTNDSSPLHIAGAFDNWIVVIPTCKHPDNILPFRNGSQYYKTMSLYKKLMIDDMEIRYTSPIVDTIDNIPTDNDILDYIPDVDYVIEKINSIFIR